MLDSVRVRLTVWYTGVLALFLILFSAASYFMFWRTTIARTDGNLAELADAFLVTLHAELGDHSGPEAIATAARVAIIEHRFRDHLFAVAMQQTGTVLVSSQDLPAVDRPLEASSAKVLASNSFRDLVRRSSREDRIFANLRGRPDGYRGVARRFSVHDQIYTLIVLQSLHPQQEMLEEVWRTFAWAIPVALILASVGGYFLARKSLAPVVAMSTQAGRMGAANLHERLPVQNAKDELGHLALAFNSLLDRLDESFERQQRFMSDASHELRTPVAILRGEAEVALSGPARASEEYRESLAVLHGEAQRLTHIVEDLFTLTRADAGQYPLVRRDFYLDELVSDCVRSARTLALPKNITLTVETLAELPIHADEVLLRRMVLNLLDNAIKYAPPGTAVHASCRRLGDEYAISVTDSGPGIPAALQSRIFERFFRADQARSRSDTEGGGAGLGLSIARWIAEAHEGRLVLIRSDEAGTVFSAFLPVPATTAC